MSATALTLLIVLVLAIIVGNILLLRQSTSFPSKKDKTATKDGTKPTKPAPYEEEDDDDGW